jgi:hypothetical protein
MIASAAKAPIIIPNHFRTQPGHQQLAGWFVILSYYRRNAYFNARSRQ